MNILYIIPVRLHRLYYPNPNSQNQSKLLLICKTANTLFSFQENIKLENSVYSRPLVNWRSVRNLCLRIASAHNLYILCRCKTEFLLRLQLYYTKLFLVVHMVHTKHITNLFNITHIASARGTNVLYFFLKFTQYKKNVRFWQNSGPVPQQGISILSSTDTAQLESHTPPEQSTPIIIIIRNVMIDWLLYGTSAQRGY